MKKFSTRLMVLVIAFMALGQTTASATDPVFNLNGSDICMGGNVEVPITVQDFTDMISFQFTVGWDLSMMQIQDVIFINDAVSSDIFFGPFSDTSSVLTVSWFDNALQGKDIAENEVLFTMLFTVQGENQDMTMLTFMDDPTMREVSALEGEDIMVVPATWNQDLVMIDVPEFANVEVTDDTDLSSSGSIDLTVMNGEAPYSFQWETGETTEDIDNLPVGDYACTVTDAKGCTLEVGPFSVGNIVAVDELPGLVMIDLVPNPSQGHVLLRADLETTTALDITIYNILGEQVYINQIESANIALDLDLSELASGPYFVQLKNKRGTHTEKLLIRR